MVFHPLGVGFLNTFEIATFRAQPLFATAFLCVVDDLLEAFANKVLGSRIGQGQARDPDHHWIFLPWNLPAHPLFLAVLARQRHNLRKAEMMSYPTHRSGIALSLTRSVALAALMSAPLIAAPLTMVNAQTQTTPAAATATETKGETVEQRITALHASLKITPAEETLWNGVAQAMRENAAAMDKLVAANRTTPPQNMSAVQDLQTYQQFAQAHVDGLKNLTSAFSTLYNAMPDDQKKVADQVFQTSGHGTAASKG
jgi:protein CpxP